jgi:hypothetical protein
MCLPLPSRYVCHGVQTINCDWGSSNYLVGSVLEHPCGWGWRWPASSRSWTPGVALGLLVVLLRASPLEQTKSKQQDKASSLEIKIADQLNYLKSAGSSVASRKRNRRGREKMGHGWACSCPHVPSPRPLLLLRHGRSALRSWRRRWDELGAREAGQRVGMGARGITGRRTKRGRFFWRTKGFSLIFLSTTVF